MYQDFDRRANHESSEMGYRETDKNQINMNNMKFLSPEISTDIYKVMAKINQQHIPVYNLPKGELYTLFYGHIFTTTVNPDGTKRLSDEEMKIYAYFMSECYFQRCSDVDVFVYQHSKDLDENEKKAFLAQAESFMNVQKKFEQILGRRDKI
jgi:hypothetical protein